MRRLGMLVVVGSLILAGSAQAQVGPGFRARQRDEFRNVQPGRPGERLRQMDPRARRAMLHRLQQRGAGPILRRELMRWRMQGQGFAPPRPGFRGGQFAPGARGQGQFGRGAAPMRGRQFGPGWQGRGMQRGVPFGGAPGMRGPGMMQGRPPARAQGQGMRGGQGMPPGRGAGDAQGPRPGARGVAPHQPQRERKQLRDPERRQVERREMDQTGPRGPGPGRRAPGQEGPARQRPE